MADEFVKVATTDEIGDGDRLIVQIGRKWVAVFNCDGEYFAIEDRCTHDDGPLAEGEFDGCEIACPRHGARFDVRTGAVVSAPAFVPVPTYAVKVEGDDVMVATKKQHKSK